MKIKLLAKLAEARAKIEARAGNASSASKPTMRPGLRRVTPRLRRLARSRAASNPSRRQGPRPKTDQVNLTDEESRIMPVSGGGFEQCYNAQAGVAATR